MLKRMCHPSLHNYHIRRINFKNKHHLIKIAIGWSAMSKSKKNFEDAEDHEIFDINDFTTASDWERWVEVYAISSNIIKSN